jgi:hypothetical protein
MAKINHGITKATEMVSTSASDWEKELNLVSWNENALEYDLRA